MRFRLADPTNAVGVITTHEMEPGRAVVLTTHTQSGLSFNDWSDVPGAMYPTSADQIVPGAVYVIDHKIYEEKPPILVDRPYYDWTLRYGFDKPDNSPYNTEVYITQPNLSDEKIPIRSGIMALAYQGAFSMPEDMFVSMTGVERGVFLTVETAAPNNGKWKVAGASDPKIAQVLAVEEDFDSGNKLVLIRML